MQVASRPNLFGLTAAQLEALLAEHRQPAFRARQVYGWLYARRARSLDQSLHEPS